MGEIEKLWSYDIVTLFTAQKNAAPRAEFLEKSARDAGFMTIAGGFTLYYLKKVSALDGYPVRTYRCEETTDGFSRGPCCTDDLGCVHFRKQYVGAFRQHPKEAVPQGSGVFGKLIDRPVVEAYSQATNREAERYVRQMLSDDFNHDASDDL
jgi:hypothetical protein